MASQRIGILGATLAGLLATASIAGPVEAGGEGKPPPPANYDPTLHIQHPRPPLLGRPPSPGNAEAGSPVHGYIHRPPAESGSITNRLNPSSTIRRGPND